MIPHVFELAWIFGFVEADTQHDIVKHQSRICCLTTEISQHTNITQFVT